MFCLPHCSWAFTNDILTTITKRVSNTLHADDLAIWNASEHTITATYRIKEATNGINKWTLDWGLKINTGKTNITLFSLSTSKEQIKLQRKGETVPQTDTPTFLGVKLGKQYTWKQQIEKMERSSLQKLALTGKLDRNYLGCRLNIFWPKFHSNSRTSQVACIHYVANGCPNQQEQAK